jgi:hypothetical protein
MTVAEKRNPSSLANPRLAHPQHWPPPPTARVHENGCCRVSTGSGGGLHRMFSLLSSSAFCFLSGPNLIAVFIISTGIDLLNYWGQPFEKRE